MCDFRFLVSADDLMDSPDFEGLCRLLGLQIPSAWLETEYEAIPRGQGDAYLFSSPEGCLFLDLFRDPTDQNEMILVGVRCKDACAAPVKATVESIYAQAPVKSAQMEEETGLLDPLLAPGRYPLERATITLTDGKKAYYFLQNLKQFFSEGGGPVSFFGTRAP